MSEPAIMPAAPNRRSAWGRNLLFLGLCLAGAGAVIGGLWNPRVPPAPRNFDAARFAQADFTSAVDRLNAAFASEWRAEGIAPVAAAPSLAVIRRLSLGLTGTLPALDEIRALEARPEATRVQWWLSRLFEDRRHSDYLAERMARMVVGVENGPFLVYRRRRMVDWMSDEIAANRPYDALVRNLIGANGIWTTSPEVNFITATIEPKKGPSEVKLAARLTRAFLGVRIDCVQCHDDMFGDRWKQTHFHELAAFFGPTEVALTGVRDSPKEAYDFRYKGTADEVRVGPQVPFQPELLPAEGTLRDRLGRWVTHPQNRAFARTTVNRVWALLFNQPLVEPIDSVPLDGPCHDGLDVLADDLVKHGFDLRRLIRVIAASRVFQLDSRTDDPARPVTEKHEENWAAFPLSRLRPDQVAGSVIQAASLHAIDAEAHIVSRIARSAQTGSFVKRFGDFGEDEFGENGGTIPQRLLMMNGNLVRERTKKNAVLNASTRIGLMAPDDRTAVETAYLCVLTRRPTPEEAAHFVKLLEGAKGDRRSEVMEDIYWTLMNSTEFSWNH